MESYFTSPTLTEIKEKLEWVQSYACTYIHISMYMCFWLYMYMCKSTGWCVCMLCCVFFFNIQISISLKFFDDLQQHGLDGVCLSLSLSLSPSLTHSCFVSTFAAASEHLWRLRNCSRVWLRLLIAVWLQQSTRKQRYIVHGLNTFGKRSISTHLSLSPSHTHTHTHVQRSGLLKLLYWNEIVLPLYLRSTLIFK